MIWILVARCADERNSFGALSRGQSPSSDRRDSVGKFVEVQLDAASAGYPKQPRPRHRPRAHHRRTQRTGKPSFWYFSSPIDTFVLSMAVAMVIAMAGKMQLRAYIQLKRHPLSQFLAVHFEPRVDDSRVVEQPDHVSGNDGFI